MDEEKGDNARGLSRRAMFGATAAAAAALPLVARAQPSAAAGAALPPLSPRGISAPIAGTTSDGSPVQGGFGPVRVLFISSYHSFDRENLFRMLDAMGTEITWCHIEHPAAEQFFDPAIAGDFDVFLFYDAFAGRKMTGLNAQGRPQYSYPPPSAKLQADLKRMLTNGDKGFVLFHHSLASWVHSWPAGVNGTNAYIEMMGGAADWGLAIENVRGRTYPKSGFRQGTEQRITIVDKTHPITAGVNDFDIVDETYLCPIMEDSVRPLLRTDFVPTVGQFAHAPNAANVGEGHPRGSNLTGWVKTAENTPLVYFQHGHDNNAWSNPSFRRLMLNAIKWAASAEAKTWARANSKRIFV